jgi:FemAB-related protein (PEP-CTERM system-associated)
MRVERTSDPGPAWDAFVESHPDAHLGHAAGWATVLRRAYGLEPHFLICRSGGGEIQGVLPLFAFRSLLGRRELVSVPYHDVAGLLVQDDRAAASLVDAALELARELGCGALELRHAEPPAMLPALEAPPASSPRVNLVLPLEAEEETQWKAVRAKVRNQVRKAEREGLTLAAGTPTELLDGFYAPFTVNMRDLGSPVHSRAFFVEMARTFGDRLRFVVTVDGRHPVGGLVAIRYDSRVTVTWASTLRSERRRCPNNQIYWEALRWAVSQGATSFDFGRSPVDGGTYRFKRGWGAEERPLSWCRLGPDGEPLPVTGAGDNPLLARLSALWPRLPLGLTVSVGSRVRRFLSS